MESGQSASLLTLEADHRQVIRQWPMGLGLDGTPEYCRAAASSIMKQWERSDLSAFADCSMPQGYCAASFHNASFWCCSIPPSQHYDNIELAVPGSWSLKGPMESAEVASL